jgi:GNAT superfamily N-acetyltransferase
MSVPLKPYSIRDACPDEAELLSELAIRSKAHWGYSPEFLESCRSELAVDANRIGSDDFKCKVAADTNGILGFYIVEKISEGVYELEALFVEPEHIGKGIGRLLVQHAIKLLSESRASRLIIQGDPNAARFYVAAGARQVGFRESNSIPGRHLPLFEIELAGR